MHASQRPATRQQPCVRRHAGSADVPAMFDLLTGPQLLERVEAALPEHRERLYPPTEALSLFVAQVLSADGSCQQAVDAAMVKRLIAGLKPGSTDTGAYCKARSRLPLAIISTLARNPLPPPPDHGATQRVISQTAGNGSGGAGRPLRRWRSTSAR